uniref:IS110 family transposase n=1 Tax=Speluncibacter jeojiensis TaxID=2710754 RepID=UPI0024100AA8|nr:IS110 family transposase [Rhodococcus sp. D2-41]
MVGDLHRTQVQIADITERTEAILAESESTLTEIHGVGPVMAGRILARTGNPFRFPTEAAFACYAGTAPVEVASADNNRHRLSRAGDRILNSAIHVVALSQARTPSSEGHAYYQRKLAEGKSQREAQRCLKRQVTRKLWRTMCQDQGRRADASHSYLPPARLA